MVTSERRTPSSASPGNGPGRCGRWWRTASSRRASGPRSRDERVRDAAVEAARSAARVGAIGVAMLRDVRVLVEAGNPHIVVDLAVAAEALRAGLSGGAMNIRANLQIARRHAAAAETIADLEADVERVADAEREVGEIIRELSSRLD